MKYIINGIAFTSKRAIIDTVHRIRDKYGNGELLSQNDSIFIYDLLTRHSENENKIGVGVKAFRAVISKYGDKAFNLIRIDDSETDFSYMKCINGKPYTGRQKFNMACRAAIYNDVIEYKNRYFGNKNEAPCEITGKIITKDDAIVHHTDIDFNNIVDNYLSERHIDPEYVEYKMGIDNHIGVEFSDELLKDDFLKYHRTHAKLSVVDKNSHSSKGVNKNGILGGEA